MGRLVKSNELSRKIFAATMWDDGLVTDLRLMEMLRKLGAPAAFALNPARHGKTRKPNNHQSQYGELVAASELKEYADFEIVNHTAHHADLTKLNIQNAEAEIVDGRTMLQDIFQRDINGFCYPYGKHNSNLANILRRHLYLYGRTCQHTDKVKNYDPMMLHAVAKWDNQNFEDLILRAHEDRDGLIIWGHSFDMKEEKHWDVLKTMYEWLLTDPRIKLVSFKEMVVASKPTLQTE